MTAGPAGLDPEGPEWDGADSDAHQARVEAGEITQDGAPRQPGTDEWGLRPDPAAEAAARAASDLEAWGGRLPEPGYGYADWLAEGRAAEAGE